MAAEPGWAGKDLKECRLKSRALRGTVAFPPPTVISRSQLQQLLDDKRQKRQLAALARDAGIAPARLTRIANGETEATDEEVGRIAAAAGLAAGTTPAPAPAKPAAKTAATPAVSPEVQALKVPVQGSLEDFPFRGELLAFAETVKTWHVDHNVAPGDLAVLNQLWNGVQAEIARVNQRLFGDPAGKKPSPETQRTAERRRRKAFHDAAKDLLSEDEMEELLDLTHQAMQDDIRATFLYVFCSAAENLLPRAKLDAINRAVENRLRRKPRQASS